MRPASLVDQAEAVLAALVVAVLIVAALASSYRAKHPALPAPAPAGEAQP